MTVRRDVFPSSHVSNIRLHRGASTRKHDLLKCGETGICYAGRRAPGL